MELKCERFYSEIQVVQFINNKKIPKENIQAITSINRGESILFWWENEVTENENN